MAKKKTPRRTPKNKKSAKKFPWLKYCLVASLWAGMFIGALVLWYAKDLPDITNSADFSKKTSITFIDRHGDQIIRYGGLQGDKVAVFDLPSHTIWAILATEDRRFYTHHGIDFIGIARAFVTNLIKGRTVQGGSTITQQLAKNLFLSHERSLKRKIQEVLLALWLETKFNKDEILTAYINRVYFGSGAYGIDAAARVYFDKPASQLTLQQSALIAGLLKAPSRYSPKNNPNLAQARTKTVLSLMHDAGYISSTEKEYSLQLSPIPRTKPTKVIRTEQYFTDWLMDRIPTLVGSISEDIIVETTFDLKINEAIENAIIQNKTNYSERGISQLAVFMSNYDGAVLSMIGGMNYGESQFNRVTQAKRQPGSAFKPFVYLTALQKGWQLEDTILDAPIDIEGYAPKNFKNEYLGEVPLSKAFALSLNTSAVRLLQEVGPQAVIETAASLGIDTPLRAEAGLALGASEVTLYDLMTAYATISRSGKSRDFYGITRISNKEDVTLYRHKSKTQHIGKRRNYEDLIIMMEETMLNGTGKAANIEGFSAGKTGTSQDYRDAWFIGFTDKVIAGVWMGNDNFSPMNGVTGGSYPARLWKDIAIIGEEAEEPSFSFGNIGRGFFGDLIKSLTENPEGSRANQPSGLNP